jgi:GT2 family glycosyltransferase
MRTAVITVMSGRHEHLRGQQEGLRSGSQQPDHRVIVAIADPDVETALLETGQEATLVHLPTTPTGLPLAWARNAGAAAALGRGAELLVFLDVDCIPGSEMLAFYTREAPRAHRHLLCGPVAYLPPKPQHGYPIAGLSQIADPHPARPAPAPGRTLDTADHQLFWSLSFAVTAHLWCDLGGFCEDYTGYGGEDTDFGQIARTAGIGIRWVGGAIAYHQFHPVNDPPVEHLDDILRNARLFRRRWGWWPMTGWLNEFANRGLITHDANSDDWMPAPGPPDLS